MRHLYKLLAGPVNTPLMIEIMRRQVELFDDNGICKSPPDDARKMGLAILQLTNGTALVSYELRRVDHDSKTPLPSINDIRYLAVLSGQVMCLVGDECPALSAGEVWWIDSRTDCTIVNKSGDDAILLGITVRMD